MQTLILITTLMLGVLPSDATNGRVEYVAAGGTQFSFSFKTFATSHVKVYKNDVLQSTGYSTVLNANQDSSPGGTVTFTTAPASGVRVKIEREVPVSNDSVWNSFSSAKSLERDLDRSAMRDQQLERRLSDYILADTANAAAANNTTPITGKGHTVSRALEDWFSDRVNVLGFIPAAYHAGIAAGTDSHDLTAYFTLALALANDRTLSVPAGKYHVSGLIIAASSNMVGEGWDSTELINDVAGTNTITLDGSTPYLGVPGAIEFAGASVQDLKISGTSNGYAVVYDTMSHGLLRRLQIVGSYMVGVYVGLTKHAYGLRIEDCNISGVAGDGVYLRSTPIKQVNAVTIIGSEIQNCGKNGVNIWGNDIDLVDNIIENNHMAGVRMDPDGITTPLEASVVGMRITENYFESNLDGAIVGSTVYSSSTGATYYAINTVIKDNYINKGSVHTGVTALITLDNSNAAGSWDGVASAWKGARIGPNYFNSGSLGWVDFKSHNDDTVKVIAPDAFSSTGPAAFSSKFPGQGTVRFLEARPLSGAGAPASSAYYAEQFYIDVSTGDRYVSKSYGGGAGDWMLDSVPTLKTRTGSNLAVNGSALDGGSWSRSGVTVDPDADGSAERVQVAPGVYGKVHQTISVTAGKTYTMSFDAESVSTGNAAGFFVWDNTHSAYLVPLTSYFGKINGSTYTSVAAAFTIPAGCTSVEINPVGIVAGDSEYVDLYIKNVAVYELVLGHPRFAAGSAIVASGTASTVVATTETGFTSAPYCTASGVTRPGPYKVATTATTLTIDPGYTTTLDESVHYTCIGK